MLSSALETSVLSDLDDQKKHAPNRPDRRLTNRAAPTPYQRRSQARIQFEQGKIAAYLKGGDVDGALKATGVDASARSK